MNLSACLFRAVSIIAKSRLSSIAADDVNAAVQDFGGVFEMFGAEYEGAVDGVLLLAIAVGSHSAATSLVIRQNVQVVELLTG